MKNKMQGNKAMMARSGQEYASTKMGKRYYEKKAREEDIETNRKLHEQA